MASSGNPFSRKLLAWYDSHARRLPWRLPRPDPYKTWISEIMLQQTQVAAVIPYFERFLRRFPSVKVLAAAEVEEVVARWSGLGYYSRARNLHEASRRIREKGTFPSTMNGWLELPGIGPYTAGAIASIAFGENVPVVDGNVIRVLTRLFALKGDPKKNPLKTRLWRVAARLVPTIRAGDFNQALMELGATICLPENPKCGVCPLRKNCRAFQLSKTADFPTPGPKQKIVKVSMKASLIEKGGKFLVARRNGARHFQGMWEFPQVPPACLGLRARKVGTYSKIRHSIMNRRLHLQPVIYHCLSGKPRLAGSYVAFQWIRKEELKNFPSSSLNFKILKGISPAETRRSEGR